MVKGVIFSTENSASSLMGDILGWTNTLSKLGVDFYIVVDKEKMVPDWEDTRMESYRVSSYEEAFRTLSQKHPECQRIRVEQTETTELKDFTHPENGCYIIGADQGIYPIGFTRDTGLKIYSPNLFAQVCISIILYDRFSKGG